VIVMDHLAPRPGADIGCRKLVERVHANEGATSRPCEIGPIAFGKL
jgi:hypothetical protein